MHKTELLLVENGAIVARCRACPFLAWPKSDSDWASVMDAADAHESARVTAHV